MQDRMKLKEFRMSLLSVGDGPGQIYKTIPDVRDRWMKIRVIVDIGAAGHVMLETLFSKCENGAQRSTQKIWYDEYRGKDDMTKGDTLRHETQGHENECHERSSTLREVT